MELIEYPSTYKSFRDGGKDCSQLSGLCLGNQIGAKSIPSCCKSGGIWQRYSPL